MYSARGEGEVERWLIEFWFRVVNIKHGRYLNSLIFTGALKLDSTYLLSILGAVPLLLLLHCSLLSCQKLPEYGTNLSSVLKDITNNRMWIVTTMISSWLVKENWWYEYVRDHHCWAESSFLNLEHEYVRDHRVLLGWKFILESLPNNPANILILVEVLRMFADMAFIIWVSEKGRYSP